MTIGCSHSDRAPLQVAQAKSRIFAPECFRGGTFAPSLFCWCDEMMNELISLRTEGCRLFRPIMSPCFAATIQPPWC